MCDYFYKLLGYIGLLMPRAKGEDLLCMQIMITLIEEEIKKQCKWVWFKVANETKSSPQQGMRLKSMGKLPGVSDYIFLKPDGNLCLEIKTEKGKLSAHQKNFEKLCKERNVPFEVAYSYDEAIAILKKYGVIL